MKYWNNVDAQCFLPIIRAVRKRGVCFRPVPFP